MNKTVSEVINLMKDKGHSMYGGEEVTQLMHGLQAAAMARSEGSPHTLVSAALLHDIGHMLHQLPDDAPDQGIDDYHENLGASYLSNHFRPEVAEPVRLHVAAKRYMCATMPDYMSKLSEVSIQSLKLQGGPMTEAEVADFEKEPYFRQAIQLRHWDDAAKDPNMKTPSLEDFIIDMEQSVKS